MVNGEVVMFSVEAVLASVKVADPQVEKPEN